MWATRGLEDKNCNIEGIDSLSTSNLRNFVRWLCGEAHPYWVRRARFPAQNPIKIRKCRRDSSKDWPRVPDGRKRTNFSALGNFGTVFLPNVIQSRLNLYLSFDVVNREDMWRKPKDPHERFTYDFQALEFEAGSPWHFALVPETIILPHWIGVRAKECALTATMFKRCVNPDSHSSHSHTRAQPSLFNQKETGTRLTYWAETGHQLTMSLQLPVFISGS